jgi:ketosteroid isomerase-like protein
MHPNAKLLTNFYEAFDRHDGKAMAEAYHDDTTFSDPVFPDLDADGVRAMWQMLTSRSEDLRVEATGIEADDRTGKAHWEAWYTFGTTGRKVHNIIDATFEFRDGKIVGHVDDFDFWRWSREALGLTGVLLGWTPIVRNKVRRTAARQLEKWRAANE